MSIDKQVYATQVDQIKIYFKTLVRNFWNEKRLGIFVSTIVIPLLITLVAGEELFHTESAFGYVYISNDTTTGGFAFICACLWIGLFNSSQKICKDRPSIDAEYRSGQSMGAYTAAQMIFEVILCLVETAILSTIAIINYGDNAPATKWIGIVITFFFVIYSADILGLLISAISKNAEKSMTIMPFILISQLVLAGCIFELEGVTDTMAYLTISKWGYEAILSICGSDDVTFYIVCWLCMILFIAVYGFLTRAALKILHFDHR